jgi:hypothetical protein
MECFLRRHGVSWRLTCSERLSGTCACDNPHPDLCPKCDGKHAEWDADGLAAVKRQIGVERRIFGDPEKCIIVRSPHFYLVTNIRTLKVRTQSGSIRIMGMHELAHLYAQRAEIAYRDFVREIGTPRQDKPCAVFLVQDRHMQQDIQERYFGDRRIEIAHGGGSRDISGYYAWNGLAESLEDTKTDYHLHLKVRHSIGHILMSCWPDVAPYPPELPKWLYAASGQWLGRLHPRLSEMSTFCSAESTPAQHSGERWHKRIGRLARGKRVPIQKVFDAAWEDLDLAAHVRVWSWFDVFLREDHDRFVEFLRRVRGGEDQRSACKAAFGCEPEEIDKRWEQRVLGRRPSVAATPAEIDAADPGRPGAKERAAIRAEEDPDTLAARIRALKVVDDPLTAATVIPRLASPSANVRETAVLVLSRTTDPAVTEWLRTDGLASAPTLARAHVARILGNIGDPAAGGELMKYASDGLWLTRAHVAFSLGALRHEPAKELLKRMIDDRSPKGSIAAMDALGGFGERAASAWEPVSKQLEAADWQVRSAAAECLGALGDMRAVEPLLVRMETEAGRIRKDAREALTRIIREDLGSNPRHWRDWWEKRKERHGGKVPPRPGPMNAPPTTEHKYERLPTYYGVRVFSHRVGYVLDVSSSMLTWMEIEADWLKKNRRKYAAVARKFDLAKHEIEASLSSLDRRVRFNLYFFRREAFTFKRGLVPAEEKTVAGAVARMAAEEPKKPPKAGRGRTSANRHQTNYVDAFRLVLDVKRGQEIAGGFRDTPDTIYFLTDGRPTTGDITDSDTLLSWYTELNRFARIRTHVIAFGRTGVDTEFLKRLAEENGGRCVLVPEAK